jgi:chemotaxis protein methyltransferase CheR
MSAGYAAIAAILKARSGLVLGPDKTYLLESRLAELMKREKLASLDALAARLAYGASSKALETEVVQAMTTNESLSFRDNKPFEALRTRILPRLHAARPANAALRIWSAAASTGQEAYSIAMIVSDLAATLGGRQTEILGTDIAKAPLARAAEGLYSQFEIQRGLPMQMLAKYFVKEDAQWRVNAKLRAAVSFREGNLLGDLRGFGMFDVIFCRNVLIYFDAPTKKRVLEAMSRQLVPDGVLFLGGAETVLGLTEALRPVPSEPGAYAPAPGLRQVA